MAVRFGGELGHVMSDFLRGWLERRERVGETIRVLHPLTPDQAPKGGTPSVAVIN